MADPIKAMTKALELISRYGGIDGDHHKQWVLDQVVRALTNCPTEKRMARSYQGTPYEYDHVGESDAYKTWVALHCDGEDGPETYSWDEGTPP